MCQRNIKSIKGNQMKKIIPILFLTLFLSIPTVSAGICVFPETAEYRNYILRIFLYALAWSLFLSIGLTILLNIKILKSLKLKKQIYGRGKLQTFIVIIGFLIGLYVLNYILFPSSVQLFEKLLPFEGTMYREYCS